MDGSGSQPPSSPGRAKETVCPGQTRWLASTGQPSASKPPPWNFTARSRSVERRHSRRKLRKSTPSGPADAGTGKYSRIRPTCLSESILVYQKARRLQIPPNYGIMWGENEWNIRRRGGLDRSEESPGFAEHGNC